MQINNVTINVLRTMAEELDRHGEVLKKIQAVLASRNLGKDKGPVEEDRAKKPGDSRHGPIVGYGPPAAGEETVDAWINRGKGMRCRTCMFFVPKLPSGVGFPGSPEQMGVGRCRRHAPTMAGYPVVFPNDWCGDHKLGETKA